jgi:hypothetical protein
MFRQSGYIGFWILLLTFSCNLKGQNFIGLHKDEIEGLLKQVNPQFKNDPDAVNHTYNYLKYVDKISEQTILFFMSDKGVCTYVRWMCDYSNLGDMISMLNKQYYKTGKNTWTYTARGHKYAVNLKEQEWYFTISIQKN